MIWFNRKTSFLLLRRYFGVSESQRGCPQTLSDLRSCSSVSISVASSGRLACSFARARSAGSTGDFPRPETLEVEQERGSHLLAGPMLRPWEPRARCSPCLHVIYRPRQKGENGKRGGKGWRPSPRGGSLPSHFHASLPGFLLGTPSVVQIPFLLSPSSAPFLSTAPCCCALSP